MDDFLDSDGFDSNFHLARLNLGEIEQAINEIEQALGVIKEILEILSLQLRDLSLGFAPNQASITDDSVERRAQLMGHAGEEIRLVAIGGVELLIKLSNSSFIRLRLAARVPSSSRFRTLNMLGKVTCGDLLKPQIDFFNRADNRPGDGVAQEKSQRDAAEGKPDHDPP